MNNFASEKGKSYLLGQSIFALNHQTDLTSVVGENCGDISDIVMLDNGKLVMCLPDQHTLMICDTYCSQVDNIYVEGRPWSVTYITNSTVAFTQLGRDNIELYDICNKFKLKTIQVPGMWLESGITTIHEKIVVCGNYRLVILDYNTGVIEQIIKTDFDFYRLHSSEDRIFYYDNYNKISNNNSTLYWYSYTDERHHTLILPSLPRGMTTLTDGSLYVLCYNESVQHVSSDGNQFDNVHGLDGHVMSYNTKQKKMCVIMNSKIQIFNET